MLWEGLQGPSATKAQEAVLSAKKWRASHQAVNGMYRSCTTCQFYHAAQHAGGVQRGHTLEAVFRPMSVGSSGTPQTGSPCSPWG